MILLDTLRDLWRFLDTRGKALAIVLVILLALVGAMEMAGVLFLFGYISALSETEQHGVMRVFSTFYRGLAGDLEGARFAAAAGALLLGFFALKSVASILANFYLLRFAMKRYERLSAGLFDGLQRAPLDTLVQSGTMEPLRVIESARRVFQSAFNPALLALSDLALITTMMAAATFVLDPLLVAGAAVVMGGVGTVFLRLTRRLSEELGERERSAEQALRLTTLEAFRGVIDVRLAGLQDAMLERYRHGAGEFALSDRRSRVLEQVPRVLNEMLLALGVVLAATYFALSGSGLENALPTLAVLGFVGLRVTSAMARLTSTFQQMQTTKQARLELIEAVDVHIHKTPAPTPPPDIADRRMAQGVAFVGVGYSYPDAENPAVKDVSFSVPRGGFVSFCGPSGGGKSTIALILMGLLAPTKGKVVCDDWDIADHPEAWRSQIGYVSQSIFIAPRSVRENVAFGLNRDEIDDDRVWAALEMAAIDTVIRSRPGGLNARLGEEGARLSGGQRQRIAIARALYRDPQILVFDEATAALDTVTEREVAGAIKRLSGERTVICIAHRLSTIRESDVIHLVEEGQIATSGTYAELETGSEPFRRLAVSEAPRGATARG